MGFELFFLCRYLLSSKHLIVYGFLQHEQNCRIRGECAFRRIFPCKALYMAVSLPQIVLWSIYSQKFNFAIHLCLDHSFPFNLSSSFCLTHLLLSLYSLLFSLFCMSACLRKSISLQYLSFCVSAELAISHRASLCRSSVTCLRRMSFCPGMLPAERCTNSTSCLTAPRTTASLA